MRFTDRVVVVTGAANGMGQSHVRRFLAEGAKVVIADLADDQGEAFARELGDDALFVHLDVTSEDSWTSLREQVTEKWGPIDVLVNNAGLGFFESVMRQTPESFRKVMEVNVTGTFLGMQAVLPDMVVRGSGAVVNICSTSGLVGAPAGLAYGASKWAVRGLTKVAAVDVANTGVRVNAVCPATVRTAMTADIPTEVYEDQPMARLAEANEVSNLVLFVASDEASFSTGSEFLVDGGTTAGRTFSFLEDPKAIAREIVASRPVAAAL